MQCAVCGVVHKQEPSKPFFWSPSFGWNQYPSEEKARKVAQRIASKGNKTVEVFLCDGSPHAILDTTMHRPDRVAAFKALPQKIKK